MKTKIEDWDESFLDVEDYQVERALTNAALDAIYRARWFGTDYVIEEKGGVKSVKPHETGPYEEQLLKELDLLNRKIAELQGEPQDSPLLKPAAQSRTKEYYVRTKMPQDGCLVLSSLPFCAGEEIEVTVRPPASLGKVSFPLRGQAYRR
jgi:hypothetical protein